MFPVYQRSASVSERWFSPSRRCRRSGCWIKCSDASAHDGKMIDGTAHKANSQRQTAFSWKRKKKKSLMYLLEPGGRKFVGLASPPEEEGADIAIGPASSPQKPCSLCWNKIPSVLQSERGKQDRGRCWLKLILKIQICREISKVGFDKNFKIQWKTFLLFMLWHHPAAPSGRTDGHTPSWVPEVHILKRSGSAVTTAWTEQRFKMKCTFNSGDVRYLLKVIVVQVRRSARISPLKLIIQNSLSGSYTGLQFMWQRVRFLSRPFWGDCTW